MKNLLALLLAGTAIGCSPEGIAVGQGLMYHAAQESISHRLNPRETNVHVYNQGGTQSNSSSNQTIGRYCYIDSTFLRNSEDENEAKSVYYVLNLRKHYYGLFGNSERYLRKISSLDLEGCPEDFKEAYEGYLQAFRGYLSTKGRGAAKTRAWMVTEGFRKELLGEAAERGVFERK